MSQNHISETMIDRLVDGELTEQEQRELLTACEADPERWKDMALAYVEAQTWRSELSNVVKEPQTPPTILRMEDSVTPRSQLSSTPPSSTRQRSTSWRMFQVAAMLFLSLTVGYGVGTINLDSPEQPPGSNVAVEPTAPINGEQLVVWVPDQESGGLQPMQVPVNNVTNLDRSKLNQHQELSRELSNALTDDGHEVTQHRTWHPVQLRDGRGAFIPTDNINVQFNGYQ